MEKIIQDVKDKFNNYPNRLNHIENVVNTAIELANHYSIDVKKAKIAAWYHDYAKLDKVEDQVRYMDLKDIKKYSETPIMYHAICAANLLSYNHNIYDPEILNAIRGHVWGIENMSDLAKIILLSDKISDDRTYDGVGNIRELAFKDLNLATLKALENIRDFQVESNLTTHQEQNKIITEIKELIDEKTK